MTSTLQTVKQIGFFTIALTLALVANFAYGQWANPTQAPTGGNIAAPINVSGLSQVKPGNLGVNTLLVDTRVLSDQYCDSLGGFCWTPGDINTILPSCAPGQSLVVTTEGNWSCGTTGSGSNANRYEWRAGTWGACSGGSTIGGQDCQFVTGSQSRSVYCFDTQTDSTVSDGNCTSVRPPSSQSCTRSVYCPWN